MHTNSTAAFARQGRLSPEEMSLDQETRDVWIAVTDNRTLRERLTQTPLRHIIYRLRRESDRSDPLALLDRLIVTMAAVGFSEATVMLLITHLQGVVARCFCGKAHRELEELDLEATRLGAEDSECLIRRLHAHEHLTVEQLEREALADELEANVLRERAKELRRVARARGRVLEFRRPITRPMGVLS
jgi:hypothetical protein